MFAYLSKRGISKNTVIVSVSILGILVLYLTISNLVTAAQDRKSAEEIAKKQQEQQKIAEQKQKEAEYQARLEQQPTPTIETLSKTSIGTNKEATIEFSVSNSDTITINNTLYTINSGKVEYKVTFKEGEEKQVLNLVAKNQNKSTPKTVTIRRDLSKEEVSDKAMQMIETYMKDENNLSQAIVLCQTFVKEQLISPKSADFPWSYDEWVKVPTAHNVLLMRSYVDAENRFGANVRTEFTCALKIENNKVVDVGVTLDE